MKPSTRDLKLFCCFALAASSLIASMSVSATKPTQFILKSAPVIHNGVGMVWARYVSGVDILQIVSGLNEEAKHNINGRMKAIFSEMLTDQAQCLLDSHNSEYDTMITVKFAGPEYISITFLVRGYCGGAHDSVSLWSETYDSKTGRKISLSSFIPGQGYAYELMLGVNPSGDFQQWESCGYGNAQIWDEGGFELTARGLHLDPPMPHANMACRRPEWAVIPWERVPRGRISYDQARHSAVPTALSTASFD